MEREEPNEPARPDTPQTPRILPAGQSEPNGKRCVDMDATLRRYIARIKTLPRTAFDQLHNCWLSTFDIFSTVRADDLSSVSLFIFNNVPAVHLMAYCRQLGIRVCGVTSERKHNGRFICQERANPEHRVVFVGKFSYFSGSDLAKQTSDFALKKGDYVYKAVCPSTDTFVYYI